MNTGPGTLAYRGYIAVAEVDMAAGAIYGEVVNSTDTITFQSQSLRELDGVFRQAVDDYLMFCRERGTPAPKPFSGKCRLRLPPDIHRKAFIAAQRSSMSFNAWAAGVLEKAVA